MILNKAQKCINLYSNVHWMQAIHLINQVQTLSYSKAYCAVFLDKDATSNPGLLQVCSRCSASFSSKRYKSHEFKKPGKIGGGGLSAHIYANKFLAGGMVDPKLPWTTVTGQSPPKKILKSTGGHTTPRRLTVLEQAYFDAITDIMACSEIGEKLAGRGLVITKVRVQDRIIGLQVFWTQTAGNLSSQSSASKVPKPGKQAQESVEEQGIEDLLKWVAPILRQELANLRVVGCTVPHINFKPDMSVRNSLDVERILLNLRGEVQESDDGAEKRAKEDHELLLEQQRRLQVPDSIFASDFVFRPVYYDAANVTKSSGTKPLSSFTPFAPLGKGLRVGPKTPEVDSTESDACLDHLEDGDTISTASAKDEEESDPAGNSPIRVRKSTPQHGILLQNNVYGINRDRIMEKIAMNLGRMKEYTSVTNADLRFPFALTLRLPSGEPEPDEQPVEHFESKSSIKNWAYRYARRTACYKSDETDVERKVSAKEAARRSIEQESLKYEQFEEEFHKEADEEDYWFEQEDRP